jgi:predicted RNA-binding Zn-ribbon protein involved in translation (DUF1610 family)
MYVIKGSINNQNVYFVGIESQKIWGSEWDVRKMSATLDGATKYDNLDIAIATCKDLGHRNFKVYPICPRCNKEYDGYPAISRKDNKTKICSECGTQEAILDFIKNKPTN